MAAVVTLLLFVSLVTGAEVTSKDSSTVTLRTTAPTTTTTVTTASPTTTTAASATTTAPTTTTTTTTTTTPTTTTAPTTTTPTTTTTTTTTPTTTTTTTTTTSIILCQNGGTYDGIKCICPDIYFGPRCETVIDRVEPERAVSTSVKVELKIDNREFDENLKNYQSEEYKAFEKDFKSLMNTVYADLEGYIDVEIVELKAGSIIVDHKVIVEVEIKENLNIETEYAQILEKVKQTVETVKENAKDCNGNDTFCFNTTYGNVTELERPNIDNFCDKRIDGNLRKYFTQMITSEGLTCISHCDTLSPAYETCNSGRCVIQDVTGPQCFCPRTDLYMYTGSRCTGRILKAGLYGGIGAAIAVVAIIIATLGFILCNREKKRKRNNDNDKWYRDGDEKWDIDRGIKNRNLHGEDYEDFGYTTMP
ncbi:mucin-17-like [Dendropsophus ebraccatus]|uniref:mucin-17-like n=1 Tax=Dendropsophus ebraccatus TaxID=150705 RepID=UPI00383190C4